MQFLIVARVSAEPEAGAPARKELVEAVLDFDEALAKAGVLVAAEGLNPGFGGARICAFWIIDVSSKGQAISWALNVPCVAGGEALEVRQVRDVTEIPDEILWPVRAAPEVAA
jgi:hypothetical protein